MKKTLMIFFISSFVLGCNSKDKTEIVKAFFESYNEKDSSTHFSFLHQDFVQTWELEKIMVDSKESYGDNYSWGSVMDDREEFEIIEATDTSVVVSSVYHCFRDSILNLGPYKSKKTFYFKEDRIVQINEHKTEDWDLLMKPRRETYDSFFEWLAIKHNKAIGDFSFNKKGAESLKLMLLEYAE